MLGCLEKDRFCGRFEIKQLLFADDTALVTDAEWLCRLVNEFGRACERKLRVNVKL